WPPSPRFAGRHASIYRDRRGQRVIASVNAPLPTLIGFSGVFVAIAIGVTLGGRADHRVPKYPVSGVQRHPITGAVAVVAFYAGTLSATTRVISRRAQATLSRHLGSTARCWRGERDGSALLLNAAVSGDTRANEEQLKLRTSGA